MDKKQLTQHLQDYRDKKISWLDLAHNLQMAVEKEIPIDGNYITHRNVLDILRAAMVAKNLGIDTDERILNTHPSNIAYLEFLKKVMKKDFEKVLEDFLNKRISATRLQEIGKEVQGLDWTGPKKLETLRRRIMRLTTDLKNFQHEYEDIRKYLSEECSELEHTLKCIFDEEFRKSYSRKEEFTV